MELLILLGSAFFVYIHKMESEAPKHLPKLPEQLLLDIPYEDRIAQAIANEDYEFAAILRDRMNGVTN